MSPGPQKWNAGIGMLKCGIAGAGIDGICGIAGAGIDGIRGIAGAGIAGI